MENKKTGRNYGIDLLRMVSMLMVVVLHVLGKGSILDSLQGKLSVNYETAWFLEIAAYCAVNCYALISGYVGVGKGSAVKYTNIVLLWLRVVFYTFLITLIFYFAFPGSVGIKDLIKAFFPVTLVDYWYVTAYFLLFFFEPILNVLLEKTPRVHLLQYIIAMIILLSLIPTVFRSDIFKAKSGYSALWLIVLYIFGGYIKKYDAFRAVRPFGAFCGYLIFICMTWALKFGFEWGTQKAFGKMNDQLFVVEYTNPFIIGAAVCLLICFSKLPLKPAFCKFIKVFSPLAFSVYLIHLEPLVCERLLVDRFVFCASFPAPLMAISVLGIAIGIYIICSFIDLVREYIFKIIKLKEHLWHLETKIRGKFAEKFSFEKISKT